MWNCDFCSHKNFVDIDPEEKPKSETISYIIEAAPVTKEEEKKSKDTTGLNKDISIVYCVDVSGSMAGSRLTAVQKTILAQIKEMAENHSERKIGVVTFTNNIQIIGDGSKKIERLDGQHLNDYNFILKTGVACA